MSSGAYALAIPAALIAIPAAAVAGAVFAVAGAVTLAKEASDAVKQIDAEKAREIAALETVRERISAIAQSVAQEMGDVSSMLENALSREYVHTDTTARVQLQGVASLDRSEAQSGFSDNELFFTELDSATGKVVYVAVDFSEALSALNAENSTEYQKMKLASAFTKRMMRLCVMQEQQESVANFIALMNRLLDDKSVSMETFEALLTERFGYLERACSVNETLDSGAWASYCAVCAMRHTQPRRISTNVELRAALEEALQAEVTDRYRAGASAALLETLQELGLELQGEVTLEALEGKLFSEPENPDYSLFVSASDRGFVLEMAQTAAPGPASEKNRESLCAKRRQLAARMLEKGYEIKVLAENDAPPQSCERIEAPKPASAAESAADRIRKRRMIEGKKGKARAIGGT